MADELVLSLGEARRLAVCSQYLAGPPPAAGVDGMRQVLRRLRVLQLDPVNVVARSHLLVLWSRLGGFDRNDLDTLLWRERWLFEYWAHAASIVLTEDYPIHRVMMRAYRTIENRPLRDWLAANEDFRRYVLDRLRDAGPLPGEGIWDRTGRLWDFAYRNEIYVPRHKRRFGSYVLPVLAGERLIGRVAPRMDRRRGELVIEGVFAEDEHAGAMADAPVAAAIESLAAFAGARSVRYPDQAPLGVS